MVSFNLGIFSSQNLEPSKAYGIIRSPSLLMDALCLAVQGAAFGVLFGAPFTGAAIGATMAITDRIFAPLIDKLPTRSFTVMGLPLGGKNIALAAVSATAVAVLSAVRFYLSF